MTSPDAKIRVLVVDDHPIVRQGVRNLLATCADMVLVGEADSAAQALALVEAVRPNVILLDIRMPEMSGVEAVRPLMHRAPEARIIMLSSFDDEDYVTQALQQGVQGYVLKSASDETLTSAVRAAHRGERVLSPPVVNRVVERFTHLSREHAVHQLGLSAEEMRILRQLVGGASNPRIAAELYLSETTVKRKLQDIFEKLGVTTRAQAAAEAVRRGLV